MSDTWKCTICGLVEGGDAPPAHCPECGAREAMFEPSNEPPHGIRHNPLQPRDNHPAEYLGPGWEGCVGEE